MDYKIIISIYAAVISTIVFIWRLYEFYYDRVGKLNITIKHTYRTIVTNNQVGNTESYLIISIVNIGKNKRYIEEPNFQCNKNIDGKKYFNLLYLNKVNKYPICLEPGQKFEYDIPYDQIKKDFEKSKINKIKVRVCDTLKKEYTSKWFNL